MKSDIWYGDIMMLAEKYGNETAKYCEGTGKLGALADAQDELRSAVLKLEYLAFKSPPCKMCKHKYEPPTFRPCCDCVETGNGWKSFVAMDT